MGGECERRSRFSQSMLSIFPGEGVGPGPYTLRGCAPTHFLPPEYRVQFSTMYGPQDKDRRSSPRQVPSYTLAQINDLSINAVHFREDFMFCLLSDGNRVCVPLTICPKLRAAPQQTRYQWRVADDGKAVVWYLGAMGQAAEEIRLVDILAHPEAQITRT